MIPTFLLEPVVGSLGSSLFARPEPDAAWPVEVTNWSQRWQALLPKALTFNSGEHRAFGRLTVAELRGWSAQLRGHQATQEVAATLEAALNAHLQPDQVLSWQTSKRSWSLNLSKPRLMGVVNVTPDSFSDGGRWLDHQAAVAHGLSLVAAGADMLDIGGESTRPGAQPVSEEEELQRVIPVIRALAQQTTTPISVDTSKAAVMVAALNAGAAMINDVTALRGDPASAAMLAHQECPVVLMHLQGTPKTMQTAPRYHHVLAEVYRFLAERVAFCQQAGIVRKRLLIDPGVGFGKNAAHNLEILRHLRVLRGLGLPLVVGVSRKRLVGAMTGLAEPAQRDVGSHALAALCLINGAHIVRVHDVAGARQAALVANGWLAGVEE